MRSTRRLASGPMGEAGGMNRSLLLQVLLRQRLEVVTISEERRGKASTLPEWVDGESTAGFFSFFGNFVFFAGVDVSRHGCGPTRARCRPRNTPAGSWPVRPRTDGDMGRAIWR